MELDITHMVNDADEMPMLSGSVFELGKDAAKITWDASKIYAEYHPLLTSESMRDEARDYFHGFGAWSDEEIAKWSDHDLEALMVQFIAGEIRQMEMFDSDEAYFVAAVHGTVSGRLSKGDNGRWYIYIGE